MHASNMIYYISVEFDLLLISGFSHVKVVGDERVEINLLLYVSKALAATRRELLHPCMICMHICLINGKSDIGEVQSDDRFYNSCKISI